MARLARVAAPTFKDPNPDSPMRLPIAASLLLASSVLQGCGGTGLWSHSIRGEGPYTTTSRQVAEFEAISMAGGMQLDIRVGEQPRVVIHADENLHQYITTRVKEGVLKIEFEQSVSSENPFRAEIDVPSLQSLDVAGSSKIAMTGLREASFELDVSGSASGTFEGEVDELTIDIAGSSNLNCFELQAQTVSIDIAGSGKVRTSASDSLDVDVAGSGVVIYRGEPSVSIDQAGSARVMQEKIEEDL